MLSFNRGIALVLTVICLLFISAINLSAATLTVTTLDDTNDSVCDAQCSLREAIEVAAPSDTIIFARQLRGGTIQLQSTLQIKKRVTIDSPNKRRITIKGNNTFRIFDLIMTNAVGGRTIILDGLIIRDGFEAKGDGGGINVDPSVSLIYITNCAVLNNTARRGGGIYMYGSGTLYLINSSVANNMATGDGGAGGIDDFRAVVYILNSTISGNRSLSFVDGAGGIRLYEPNNWFINGSTIADNSSNGSSYYSAGGLAALNGRGPGPLTNTILARNNGLNPDYYGVSSGAYNSLIGITDSRSGFNNGVNGSIVGSAENPVDPHFSALADNGGGLPTHALLSTSRAIDSGNNDRSINQQGRPQEIDQRTYNRIVNSTVDIGAYEFNSQPFATTSTVSGQVTTASGRGVFGARVVLRDENGAVKYALTNPFGYYRFVNIAADMVFTIECSGKGKIFAPQNVLVEESTELVDFRAS